MSGAQGARPVNSLVALFGKRVADCHALPYVC